VINIDIVIGCEA